MKIKLEKRKVPAWHAPGIAATHLTESLPFLQTAFRLFKEVIE